MNAATSTLDSTKIAGVDKDYNWMPIDAATQKGVKLQLINKDAGVACYGKLNAKDTFWTHWAPLPTFEE